MTLQKPVAVVMLFILTIQIGTLRPSITIGDSNYGFASSLLPLEVFLPQQMRTTLAATLVRSEPTKLLFVGDIMLARNLESLMTRHGVDYPYRGIDLSATAADQYVVGNFEASVPLVHQPTEAGSLRFSVDPNFLPALRSAGFTHLSLANNHALDHGVSGFTNSQVHLEGGNMDTFGDPRYLNSDTVSYVTLGTRTVALIGYQAFGATPTAAELAVFMKEVERRSDLQVLFVHWGNEYEREHSRAQERTAAEFITEGVDLIIGHHPHVVQDIGIINGVPVFYSLGNFIFDQYLSVHTEQGLMVQLDLADEPTLRLIPVTSEFSASQPQLTDETSRARFLHDLAKRSADQLSGYIERGYVPLNTVVATSSKVAMMN